MLICNIQILDTINTNNTCMYNQLFFDLSGVLCCISEPGEFSFEQASYYANVVTGDVTCNIIRRKGCDGTVSLTYNTM